MKPKVKKVTPEEATNIIETRQPLGKFYCIEQGTYIGIDNEDGEAWTEDFRSLSACRRLLLED